MSKKDYYTILGLPSTCTFQEIKKNYHKLALIWHPDKHVNKCEAQNKFTEIQEAYSVLADDKKRKVYDQYGIQGLASEQGVAPGFGHCHRKNFFNEKGFCGTNKSAFEVFKDIFQDSDEEDFPETHQAFKISDNFKDNLKSFMEDFICSENEETDNFFKSYIPTFMDNSFYCSPPVFQSAPSHNDCSTQQGEFFTFFTSEGPEIQNFPRTSSTSAQDSKIKTLPKQRAQQEGFLYEDAQSHQYNSSQSAQPTLIEQLAGLKGVGKKSPEIIEIDDESVKESKKTSNKHDKFNQANLFFKEDCKIESKEEKKAYRLLDLEALSDDDADLFGGTEFFFNQRNCKRNKI